MWGTRKVGVVAFWAAVVWFAAGDAVEAGDTRTFGGYTCMSDCSGHKAGYEWAQRNAITDKTQCGDILANLPNRVSFHEGCLAYADNPFRGADEDDDRNAIK